MYQRVIAIAIRDPIRDRFFLRMKASLDIHDHACDEHLAGHEPRDQLRVGCAIELTWSACGKRLPSGIIRQRRFFNGIARRYLSRGKDTLAPHLVPFSLSHG